jgi:hypothetical protein
LCSPNMATRGVGGVQMWSMGCRMVGGFGKISRGAGHIRFEVADSSKIRFWHDVWCGADSRKLLWQTIWIFLVPLRMVNFLRAAHDWEADLFTSFFNLLYSLRLRRGGENRLCWVPFKRGLFDVRLYYNVLVPHDSILFHWRSIWRNKVPLRGVFCLVGGIREDPHHGPP